MKMPRLLTLSLSLTDVASLCYGSVFGLAQAGLVKIPPAWTYTHFDQPKVVA